MNFTHTELFGPLCLFCAAPAEHRHHTPSTKASRTFSSDFWFEEKPRYALLIPICAECNYILGGEFPWQLHKQAERVFLALNKRSNKVVWSNEELHELGYALRSKVEATQQRARTGKNRTWRAFRRHRMLLLWEENEGPPEDLQTLLFEPLPLTVPQSLAKRYRESS